MLQVTSSLSDCLKKFSLLQSVKLDGCLITYDGLKTIGNWCVSLRELSLSKCSGVTDEGLSSVVKKHKDLRKLDITCCRKITDVSIAHVTNSCNSLCSLRMESCTLVSREAFVLIGQRCHLLEELDLTENEIDDKGFSFFFSFASIVRTMVLMDALTISSLCRSGVHLQMLQTILLKTRNLP